MDEQQLPEQTNDNNRIIPVNIEEQMKAAYIDYSMSVIVGRALPDVRDGLKPVHRRVLFAMHELGNTFNKPHKKCARIVGEVLGKYHPHGDAAIGEAIVNLGQKELLFDIQGNWGDVRTGDSAAAPRYIEVRLSKGDVIPDRSRAASVSVASEPFSNRPRNEDLRDRPRSSTVVDPNEALSVFPVDDYENGRAEALATLCKICCSKYTHRCRIYQHHVSIRLT